METRRIILCRGIQGSGKTTWSKQWVLEKPESRIRFNNDDIRNMFGKYWMPNREPIIDSLKHTFLEECMKNKYDIVVDNMNLNPLEINYYKHRISEYNKYHSKKNIN